MDVGKAAKGVSPAIFRFFILRMVLPFIRLMQVFLIACSLPLAIVCYTLLGYMEESDIKDGTTEGRLVRFFIFMFEIPVFMIILIAYAPFNKVRKRLNAYVQGEDKVVDDPSASG